MDFLILIILIGLIPAFIAKMKGRSFLSWWLYGSLIFLFAFPHAIFMGSRLKQCPFCAEMIQNAASVCKHCGRDQPEVVPA